MPLSKESSFTTDYIFSLPEGQRAELIDGVVYDMAPPNRLHQELVSELHYKITDYIKKNNGACKVFPSPFAVFLNAKLMWNRISVLFVTNPSWMTADVSVHRTGSLKLHLQVPNARITV